MNKLFKSLESPVADIDEKSNTVSVYYAAFNNEDNGREIIMPGACTKTIKERGPSGKDLVYHFKNHYESISKPKELLADSYGLKAVVTFPNTTVGRDTVEEYKFGMWKYHSIGYATIKDQKNGDITELHEIKLYEGSHVNWPMNELAVTQYVDLKNSDQHLRQMMQKMEDFIKKSTATDETIKKFELQLTEIKRLITEPPAGTQPTKEDLLSVFNHFKN